MDDEKIVKETFGEQLLRIAEQYKAIEEKVAKLSHSISWHDDSILKDREELSKMTMELGHLGEKVLALTKGGIPCAQ